MFCMSFVGVRFLIKKKKSLPDWKVKYFESFYGEKKKIEPVEVVLPTFSFVEFEKDLPPKDYSAVVSHKDFFFFFFFFFSLF